MWTDPHHELPVRQLLAAGGERRGVLNAHFVRLANVAQRQQHPRLVADLTHGNKSSVWRLSAEFCCVPAPWASLFKDFTQT